MLQNRKAYLEELNSSVLDYKHNLDNILTKLGWTHQGLQSQHELKKSSINEESNKDESLESKAENRWDCTVEGSGQDLWLNVVDELWKIPPENSDKLYNELVASLSEPTKIKCGNKKETDVLVHMLAMERDAKRRRISYKNKVHTKNKSHTEVLREVLEQQMEILKGSAQSLPNLSQIEDKKDENDKLIDMGTVFDDYCNPHLVWKNVGKYLEMKESTKKNSYRSTSSKEKTKHHKEDSKHKSSRERRDSIKNDHNDSRHRKHKRHQIKISDDKVKSKHKQTDSSHRHRHHSPHSKKNKDHKSKGLG